jgi:VanZ family protein
MPPVDPTPAQRRFTRQLCLLLALLILYGSWFPFHWIRPHPDDVMWALTDTTVFTGRADLLGNVALFLPWGAAAAGFARVRGRAPWRHACASGLLLALLAQAGQFFELYRDPRWADVLWNSVGAALGALPLAWGRGWPAARAARGTPATQRSHGPPTLFLIAGSLLVAWLPLWPTLDAQRLLLHWWPLGSVQAWQGADAAMLAGLALVGGSAAAWRWPRRPAAAAVFVAGAMLGGQLLVPGSRLSAGGAIGLACGAALAIALQARPRAAALAMLALLVAGGLAPFRFQPYPQPLHAWPFEAMVAGPMLTSAQALARDVWLWGWALWMGTRSGWSLWSSTGSGWPLRGLTPALALLALGLELAQCWIPSRTPDLSSALLVLITGWVLAGVRDLQAQPA